MTLVELQERRQQLENSINLGTQQVYILQGHKAEVDYQISELNKINNETKVDEPVVTHDEPTVEC
jgi:hypothetical protein